MHIIILILGFTILLVVAQHFGGGVVIDALERRLAHLVDRAKFEVTAEYEDRGVPILKGLGLASIIIMVIAVVSAGLICLPTDVYWVPGLMFAIAGVGTILTVWNVRRSNQQFSLTTQLNVTFTTLLLLGSCMFAAGLSRPTLDAQLDHVLALFGAACILMALKLPDLYGEIGVRLAAYGVYLLEGGANWLLRIGIAIATDGKKGLKDVTGADGAVIAREEDWMPKYRKVWRKVYNFVYPLLVMGGALPAFVVISFMSCFGFFRQVTWSYLEENDIDTTGRRQKSVLAFEKLFYLVMFLVAAPSFFIPGAAAKIDKICDALWAIAINTCGKIYDALVVGINPFAWALVFGTALGFVIWLQHQPQKEVKADDKTDATHGERAAPVWYKITTGALGLAIAICTVCFVWVNVTHPLKKKVEAKVDAALGDPQPAKPRPLAELLVPRLFHMPKELAVHIGFPALPEPERFEKCTMTIERSEPNVLAYTILKDGIPMDRPKWIDDSTEAGKRYLYRLKLDCPKTAVVVGRVREIVIDGEKKSPPGHAPSRKTALASCMGVACGKPGKDAYCMRHPDRPLCQ